MYLLLPDLFCCVVLFCSKLYFESISVYFHFGSSAYASCVPSASLAIVSSSSANLQLPTHNLPFLRLQSELEDRLKSFDAISWSTSMLITNVSQIKIVFTGTRAVATKTTFPRLLCSCLPVANVRELSLVSVSLLPGRVKTGSSVSLSTEINEWTRWRNVCVPVSVESKSRLFLLSPLEDWCTCLEAFGWRRLEFRWV